MGKRQLAGREQPGHLGAGCVADLGAGVASTTDEEDAGVSPSVPGDADDPVRVADERERHVDRLVGADRVDGGVDPFGCEGTYPVLETLAVGDRLGTQGAEVVVVALAGRRDDASAATSGQLDDEAADPAGGSVDQDRPALADAGGLDRVGRRAAGDGHARGQLPRQAVRLGQEPAAGTTAWSV